MHKSTCLCLLVLAATILAGDARPAAAMDKVWSVKFLCGTVPEFPLSVWFSDVNIHNPHELPVPMKFKVVTEDAVLRQGTLILGPNRVLDAGCAEIVGPPAWHYKGFVELEAPEILQVIGILKNYAFTELKTEKGFYIPPRMTREGRWVYATEYICGEIAPRVPASLGDVLALIPPEDHARIWRPGVEGTDFFLHNAGETTTVYSLRVVDVAGRVLHSEERQQLEPGGVLKVDCDRFERLEPRSEGFYVVEADSGFLNASIDIWKYLTAFSVTMDADPYVPLFERGD